MANRWFGRNRRTPREQAAATAARDGAVAAFLDLDTRQRFVTEAVQALQTLEPQSRTPKAWQRVEQTCFDATAEYVSTSTRFEPATTGTDAFDVYGATSAFQQTHRVLADAATAVDAFYDSHRTELDHARSALAATPRIAEDAVAALRSARAALADGSAYAAFPSVQAVTRTVDAAAADLDRALAANSAVGVRSAAAAVRAAGQAVADVLEAARGAESRARTTLSSVRTRIDAVNSRIERLPPARSTLLREFSEPNSADLVGNLALATTELDAGRQRWADAGAAVGTPEVALDLLASAREHLNTAAAACDAVTDRLAALSQVRDDPAQAERQTRFRVRDAQLLVVDRGLTAEWGSVLDAQSRRIDVARERLVGTHPNYWAYLTELGSVQDFVKGVVERVREHAEAGASRRR